MQRGVQGVRPAQRVGRALLWLAPWLMKTLSVLGTAAMFLVGGGILAHGWHALGEQLESLSQAAGSGAALANLLLTLVVGVVAGGVALGAVQLVQRVRGAAS